MSLGFWAQNKAFSSTRLTLVEGGGGFQNNSPDPVQNIQLSYDAQLLLKPNWAMPNRIWEPTSVSCVCGQLQATLPEPWAGSAMLCVKVSECINPTALFNFSPLLERNSFASYLARIMPWHSLWTFFSFLFNFQKNQMMFA